MFKTLIRLLMAGVSLMARLQPDASDPEPLLTYGFVKPSRKVTRVFLHCTASDHAHHDNLETLRKWHVDERGWSATGYHALIPFAGGVQLTDRSMERTPAAQKGHNAGTIAITLSGGQHGKATAFTQKQFQTLKSYCREIHEAYGGQVTFHGHSEVARGRACPVYDYKTILGLDAAGRMKGV